MSRVQHQPQVEIARDRRTVTVTVPLNLVQRGGRKVVLAPDDAPAWVPRLAPVDNSLIHALVRGHRWQRMLENGTYNSAATIAQDLYERSTGRPPALGGGSNGRSTSARRR